MSLSTYEAHSWSFCKPDLPRLRPYRCCWPLLTEIVEGKRKGLSNGLDCPGCMKICEHISPPAPFDI